MSTSTFVNVATATDTARPGVTHEAIAQALRERPDDPVHPPTDEQRRVIEAPPAPSLVVAGAGSGKTHTMVRRMLWLVARHGVAPSSLLGLTFTRKAAGELRERVDEGLRRLRAAELIEGDEADLPEVSTYNSFAHRLFHEHALLIGREPEAVLLDESASFALMRRIVLRSDDPALGDLGDSIGKVTECSLDLARAMRENGVGRGDADAFAATMEALRSLPGRPVKGALVPLKELADHLDKLDRLRPYARLAEEYEAAKRERGLIEFTDQVAGALEICERAPEVAQSLRQRHEHVILDEYQDTSVGQTRLLAGLFRGHSLMAVGDPKQSIYGWRGASAANMSRFHVDFGADQNATFTLSTSWRNDVTILAAANLVARPLSAGERNQLPELAPRPGAGAGSVEVHVDETIDGEVAALADWIAAAFEGPGGRTSANAVVSVRDDAPSAAVLFRTRRHMARVERELTRRGIPVRVVGLGGLLSTPELTDLAAVLRAARDPDAGSHLIRLLVGARVRLGPADVTALHGIARRLAPRARPDDASPTEDPASGRLDLGPDVETSLADAVEFVASARADHGLLEPLSAATRERVAEVAALLDDVRAHLGLPLVELVEYAIRRADIDLEAASNPHRPTAIDNLDVFLDHVVDYAAAHPSGDIGGLLDWLDISAARDDLAAATVEPEPGAVQLLTIHGAKGLEWDLVAVPDLIDGGLPQTSREGTGWFRAGVLPYPLRLDRDDLPRFAPTGYASQSEARDAVKRLSDEVKARFLTEERRLAYVAFTRARRSLLLTASYWGGGKRPRDLSPYVLELAAAGVIPQPPERVNDERPALLDAADEISWPRPPFRDGEGVAMSRAAAAVEAHVHAARDSGEWPTTPWDRDIELLLRERDERRRVRPVTMPARLAASHFKDLVLDPEAAAAQWRRPLPQRPFRQTRLGTMFHAWVEARFEARASGGDLLDGDVLELDPDELELLGIAAPTTSDARRLADLQVRFERSTWARRRPVAVEQTIEAPLGGRTVVCKLDAVYELDDGTVEVVDWKTGSAPRGTAAEWERQLQLALYTLAYSQHRGIPAQRIRAVLFYVAEGDAGTEYRFDRVSDRAELERLLADAEARIIALAADPE